MNLILPKRKKSQLDVTSQNRIRLTYAGMRRKGYHFQFDTISLFLKNSIIIHSSIYYFYKKHHFIKKDVKRYKDKCKTIPFSIKRNLEYLFFKKYNSIKSKP